MRYNWAAFHENSTQKVGELEFTPTSIPDVFLIKPQVFGDERGFFLETYNSQQYIEAGISAQFVQDNHSGSSRGVLRGLHYQIHQAQGKLVRVVSGEIFDVAVDIRRSSSTFGKWSGQILSAENKRQVWIPAGFAHGFYVLSDWAELVYKATDFYAPKWERTLMWDDPEIGIEWPLIAGHPPVLSEKDRHGTPLRQAELYE
jgi:dTDP-4-dehydrorhamnose 3,5-epimerase